MSLPEDADRQLDSIKTEMDAQTKLDRIMAFGAGMKEPVLTPEQRQIELKNYMLPEEMERLPTGMTPAEAVTRYVNEQLYKEDVKAKISKTLETPLAEFRAKTGIQTEVDPAAIATLLETPEYIQLADEIVKKMEFNIHGGEREEIMRGNERIVGLMNQHADEPAVVAALQQELDANNRILNPIKEGYEATVKYDPEVAAALEGVIPESELATFRKRLEVNREVSDATPYLYAYLREQEKAGVPASTVRVKKSFIVQEMERYGWVEEAVPGSETSNLDDAKITMSNLTSMAEPGVKYHIDYDTLADGTRRYRVDKKTNSFRSMIDNKDFIVPDADKQMDLAAYAEELGVDPLELMDAKNLQEAVFKESKRGIADGVVEFSERYQARQRAVIASLRPGVGTKGLKVEKTEKLKQQMMVLFEATFVNPSSMPHMPKIVIPKRKGNIPYKTESGLPYFEVKMPEKVDILIDIMEKAGVPFDFTKANKTADVKRAVEHIYEVMMPALQGDPLLQRYAGKIDAMTRAVNEAGPGETPEYAYTVETTKDFIAKAKILGRKVDMSVAQDNIGLRDMMIQRYGKQKGMNKYDEFLRKGSGTAEGFYDKDEKHIVLVAENIFPKAHEITYEQAVHRVLWHESAGHFGLQQMLGNEYNAVLRRVLNAMPDETRRTIAELYTKGDKNHPIVAAEYMARMSEEDPRLGLLQTFYGELRALARKVGKEMTLTDLDMRLLAKKSRDYLFKSSGIHRPGVSTDDFQETSMSPEPNPLKPSYSLAQRYLSPSDPLAGLPSAYDVARNGAMHRGLDETEANNQASRGMGSIQSGDAISSFRWAEKEFVADSPLVGNHMTIKRSPSPRETMSRMIQAKTLHDGFARSLKWTI